MTSKVMTWLDERLGLTGMYDTVLDRNVPKVNWWFTLGSASLFLFILQGATGIFLTVYYAPTPDLTTLAHLVRGDYPWRL